MLAEPKVPLGHVSSLSNRDLLLRYKDRGVRFEAKWESESSSSSTLWVRRN